jgi:hypothetical protein
MGEGDGVGESLNLGYKKTAHSQPPLPTHKHPKYCKQPAEATNVEISAKRKRGRSSTVKKALLIQ